MPANLRRLNKHSRLMALLGAAAISGVALAATINEDDKLTAPDAAANDDFGLGIGEGGDFNGDGFLDLAVSARGRDSSTGIVYLYYGSATGLSSPTALSAADTASCSTPLAYGLHVESAGDLDNDGFDDLLVGAGSANSTQGCAFIYYGSTSGIDAASEVAITNPGGVVYFGGLDNEVEGDPIDVNGDGYDDVLIPSHSASNTAHVFLGSASGVDTANPIVLTGPGNVGALAKGDFNLDGYGDVVLAQDNGGAMVVYEGGPSGMTSGATTTTPSGRAWTISTGDVNGDGYLDLGVATRALDFYIYYGTASGLDFSSTPQTVTGPSTTPSKNDAAQRAKLVDDYDGDGYDDLMLEELRYNNNAKAGIVYFYAGSASGMSSSYTDTLLPSTPQNGALFGYRIASLGDMDNDEQFDYAIVAPYEDGRRGAVYLYEGAISPNAGGGGSETSTDSDGDGVLDNDDVCPCEDATDLDNDGDGCIDSDISFTGVDVNTSVAVAPDGTVYAAARNQSRLYYFSPDGTALGSFTTVAQSSDLEIDVAPDGTVWVAGRTQIGHYQADGTIIGTYAPSGLSNAQGIAIDHTNELVYISDFGGGSQIFVLDLDGNLVDSFASGEDYPLSIGVCSDGSIATFSYFENKITLQDPSDGSVLDSVVSDIAAFSDGAYYGSSLDCDAHGNLYLADSFGSRILVYDAALTLIDAVTQTAGGQSFSVPHGLDLDDNGQLYMADSTLDRSFALGLYAGSGGLLSGDSYDTCLSGGDSDGDGVPDSEDICEGGDDNVDADGDSVPDFCDACPDDANDDSDGDGSCDSADLCAGDDTTGDTDADGVCDSDDACEGDDATGDTDGDLVCDGSDVCPADLNDDSDGDGSCDSADLCEGDDATGDTDGDAVCDDIDLCSGDDLYGDTDLDGVCDDIDACPVDNPDDTDGDTVCDSDDACPLDVNDDSDGDGVCDSDDLCPDDVNDDSDGDGVCDSDDACPADLNDDSDGDGVCDSDDACPADVLNDSDGDGSCDSVDLCTGDDTTGDTDSDGVCDAIDACDGDDATGDTDGDAVCDDIDACPVDALDDSDGDGSCDSVDVCTGDDATGDADSDAICDDVDVCQGDDAVGDTDADGFCDDTDLCETDPDKIEPGDCGCGTADVDDNGNGYLDCLEEGIELQEDFSYLWFNDSYGFGVFTGQVELTGGLLAPDFREDGDIAHGGITLTLGETSPVVVYDNDDITFSVRDHRNDQDNQEKWGYFESWDERATIRWKNSQKYKANNDSSLPDGSGKLRSRFIHADETRLRFNFGSATLPVTITIDGIHVLTVDEDGDTFSELPLWSRGSRVDVIFPDRLGDGNVVAWYSDADPSDGFDSFVYSHEAIDDGTGDATFFNAGGRFHVVLPTSGLGLDESSATPYAQLQLTVGDQNTAVIATGVANFGQYDVWNNFWLFHEDDDE